jgi:hypothetical protein
MQRVLGKLRGSANLGLANREVILRLVQPALNESLFMKVRINDAFHVPWVNHTIEIVLDLAQTVYQSVRVQFS